MRLFPVDEIADRLEILASTPAEVIALSPEERTERVRALMDEAFWLADEAEQRFIVDDGKAVAGRVVLFSGGNDSTVLAHLFRNFATHAAHANTTIGVEQTRQFVRDTCAAWNLPLVERTPPNPADHYRSLVLDQGFPGPGHHYKMFQRLKERGLRVVAKELNPNPRKARLLFIAGRRRTESERRASVPEFERRKSVVWVSPLLNWTSPDLAHYRQMFPDTPRNEVTDLLHMSGECLCGAFAHANEAEELATWVPDAWKQIADLQDEIADREDIPVERRTWGWGGDVGALREAMATARSGALCQSCPNRYNHSLFGESDPSEAA